jgi:Ala-tRNA(Pro) deacylase
MEYQKLLSLLEEHNISYTLYEHDPIFTSQEGEHLKKCVPGLHNKNLFLQDGQGRFFLVTVEDSKRVDLKALAMQLNSKRFSFAKADDLFSKLHLLPGSVTPLALMFDSADDVEYYLDEDLMLSTKVNVHPLRNDMTLAITPEDFGKFLEIVGRSLRIIKIPQKLS